MVKNIGEGSLLWPTNSFSDETPVWTDKLQYLHMYHSGNTPIDFGIKRSTVKVTGQGSLHLPTNLFCG